MVGNLIEMKQMSVDKAFLDTNVLVYLYSDSEKDKQQKAFKEINKYIRFVSTQVLTEFCNICLKKLQLSRFDVDNALTEILNTCNLIIVDDSDIRKSISIYEKYKYSYYDSLVIESAIEADCDFLLTEDMYDGQIIENTLEIRNIFK